jgi:hypothetical protein
MDRETTKWKENEAIKWDELCMVRSIVDVKNQIKVEGGKLVSISPLNSSKGDIPRLTVHWALNHVVGDHLYGSWANGNLVIVSPGDKIVEENGVPENLNAVDTFWAKDVVIPKGSKLLWFEREVPTELLNIEGVENKVYKIPNDYKKSLDDSLLVYEQCRKDWRAKKEGVTLDDFCRTEGDTFYWGKKVKDEIDEMVNKELTEMGYEIFEGDHGSYMDGPMAGPIYNLANAEKITSDIHSDTLLGDLEGGFFLQPLIQLARETDKDMFEVNEKGETDFLRILRAGKGVIKSHQVNERQLTHGEQTQLLIFATELFNRVRNNEESLGKTELRALREFLSASDLIRRNWLNWDVELVRYIYRE